MLDLSPEKLIVLLAVATIVLGPDKLPTAARNLAHGLARARKLAASLTDPITTTLVGPVKVGIAGPLESGMERPRQRTDDAVAELRSSIASHSLPEATRQQPVDRSPGA